MAWAMVRAVDKVRETEGVKAPLMAAVMAPMMAEAMATVEADSDWEEEAMATAAKAKEGVVTEEEQAEAVEGRGA
jgi:hypothetical protein